MARSRSPPRLYLLIDNGDYSISGIFVQLESTVGLKTLSLTATQALKLVRPWVGPEDFGRYCGDAFVAFDAPDRYCLQMVEPAKTKRPDKMSYILKTEQAFYNFAMKSWSPLESLPKYMGNHYLLYVACSPLCTSVDHVSLLIKIGYSNKRDDSDKLITYLEKKSKLLRLSNQPDAFIFAFPVPDAFLEFPRPEIAAEDSLKQMFINSNKFRAMPSNREGERLPKYRSEEWFVVSPRLGERNVNVDFLYIGRCAEIYHSIVMDLQQFASQQ